MVSSTQAPRCCRGVTSLQRAAAAADAALNSAHGKAQGSCTHRAGTAFASRTRSPMQRSPCPPPPAPLSHPRLLQGTPLPSLPVPHRAQHHGHSLLPLERAPSPRSPQARGVRRKAVPWCVFCLPDQRQSLPSPSSSSAARLGQEEMLHWDSRSGLSSWLRHKLPTSPCITQHLPCPSVPIPPEVLPIAPTGQLQGQKFRGGSQNPRQGRGSVKAV